MLYLSARRMYFVSLGPAGISMTTGEYSAAEPQSWTTWECRGLM